MDENCYDQFSVINDCGQAGGSTTAIYLNSIPEPTEIQKREVRYYFIFCWTSKHCCFTLLIGIFNSYNQGRI